MMQKLSLKEGKDITRYPWKTPLPRHETQTDSQRFSGSFINLIYDLIFYGLVVETWCGTDTS